MKSQLHPLATLLPGKALQVPNARGWVDPTECILTATMKKSLPSHPVYSLVTIPDCVVSTIHACQTEAQSITQQPVICITGHHNACHCITL